MFDSSGIVGAEFRHIREETSRLEQILSNWIETAAQNHRNAEYYRGLLVQIGEIIGEQAFTADDGTKMDSVLCAKLPELVRTLKTCYEGFKKDYMSLLLTNALEKEEFPIKKED